MIIKSIGERVILRRDLPPNEETGIVETEEWSLTVEEANSLINSQNLLEAVIAAKGNARTALLDRASKLEAEAKGLREAARDDADRHRLRTLVANGINRH